MVDKTRIKNELLSMGVDQLMSETPVNRLEKKADTPIPVKADVKAISIASTPAKGLSTQIEETENLAAACQSLEELKSAIQNYDGLAVKKTALNMVFCDGNPQAKVMLIGEAPGAEEDKQAKPFVGQSGQLLRKIFRFAGLDLEHIYISNVFNWRPPGNRTPTPQEIAIARPFIQRHIELVNPDIVVMVGGTSCKALVDAKDGITKLRGKWFDLDFLKSNSTVKAMAIYHPAYLLRSPSRKKDVWQDVLAIKHYING
jgi:DNA polymerase